MVCEPAYLACSDFCILRAVLGFSLSALALFGMMGFLLSWADPSFPLETTNECRGHIKPSSLQYYFLLF